MRDEGWLLGLHCRYSCGALGHCNLNQKKKKREGEEWEGIRSTVFGVIMGQRGGRGDNTSYWALIVPLLTTTTCILPSLESASNSSTYALRICPGLLHKEKK